MTPSEQVVEAYLTKIATATALGIGNLHITQDLLNGTPFKVDDETHALILDALVKEKQIEIRDGFLICINNEIVDEARTTLRSLGICK